PPSWPGVVLLARVPRSSSKQRPMPAGRWISSTTSSPAADASASSMWSKTSRSSAENTSMVEINVAHDISHGLKANHQITIDGLRRRDTLDLLEARIVGAP